MGGWSVYILRCADSTLYTGITNDLAERLAAHHQGQGARYTRGRGPFELVHCEQVASRGEALRRELQLKKLSRRQKLSLSSKLPEQSGS
ncbi:MAG: GIY-YIG nuclease family protein [Deltaproteobacteria bacterium]|nr:GIY-YIG nuclease family protein [Deltaproteobacteria bacterium]